MFPTGLNNIKTKVDDLNIDKLKAVPVVSKKKMSDVMRKKVVKKAVYNKLNTKANNLKNKIPDATTLVYINQYNTDKQNLEKKIGDVDKKS